MFRPPSFVKKNYKSEVVCHISFDFFICALSPSLSARAPQRHYISFLLAKQNYGWRRKGSAVSSLCLGSIADVAPRRSPKSGREVPVQRLHRPIRHNCHTSAIILIWKQTIVLCVCWDGRGEGVSRSQVVHKSPQATGTLPATSAPHVHSTTQHLVSLLIFFLPKISQIWKVLISFLFSFWKKCFILIEPKGWLSHWNI